MKQLKNFITAKSCKLNFWRHHNKKTADPKIYNSCVPNGTCGFQLDFLLRERRQHNQFSGREFDLYINAPKYHISKRTQMDYFKLYLNTLLHDSRSTLFMLVKRPHIDQSLKNNVPSKNTYMNYDEWFYEQKKNSEKKHPQVYLEETYFY